MCGNGADILFMFVWWTILLCGFITPQVSSETLRFPDRPFRNQTHLYGYTITCEERPSTLFPSDTWSCHNMRIGGMYMKYWCIQSSGNKRDFRHDKKEFTELNDIASLCRELMRAHGIHRELWTAFASDASCDKSREERVFFRKRQSPPGFYWERHASGYGYIRSMQCMALN